MLVATVGHPVRCIVCGGQRKCRRSEVVMSVARDSEGRAVEGERQHQARTAKAWRSDDALAEVCARCRHVPEETITMALLMHGDDAFATIEIV